MNADGENHGKEDAGSERLPVTEQMGDNGNTPLPRPPHQLEAGRMTPVGQQHVGPEALEDLPASWRKTSASRLSGDRPARLEAVGMTVTRTPFTLK